MEAERQKSRERDSGREKAGRDRRETVRVRETALGRDRDIHPRDGRSGASVQRARAQGLKQTRAMERHRRAQMQEER